MFDFSVFPWSCFYLTNAFVPIVGEQVMSTVDVLMTFLFGVLLPSWDVYSDMGLAYRFLTKRCHTFTSSLYSKYHQWKLRDSKSTNCPIVPNEFKYNYNVSGKEFDSQIDNQLVQLGCFKRMNEISIYCPTYLDEELRNTLHLKELFSKMNEHEMPLA